MRWGGIFDVDQKKVEYEEESLRTQAPDFWEDRERAEAQMKKVKEIKKWIDGYNEVKMLCDEVELSIDYLKEKIVTEDDVDEAYSKAIRAVENLEIKNMDGCRWICFIKLEIKN